jgi:hypothetical protein
LNPSCNKFDHLWTAFFWHYTKPPEAASPTSETRTELRFSFFLSFPFDFTFGSAAQGPNNGYDAVLRAFMYTGKMD